MLLSNIRAYEDMRTYGLPIHTSILDHGFGHKISKWFPPSPTQTETLDFQRRTVETDS